MPHPNLAAALAAAQSEFPDITKDKVAKVQSTKGSYEYGYTDLASILKAVRPVLAKNQLAVVQVIEQRDDWLALVTRLLHASGENLDSIIPIGVDGPPQQFGSALTYYRRYALCGLLGIAAEEDDDAQSAQDNRPRRAAKADRRDAPPRPESSTNSAPPAEPAGERASGAPRIFNADGVEVAVFPSYGHLVKWLDEQAFSERVALCAVPANRKLLQLISDSQKAPKALRDRAEALWNLGTDETLGQAA